MVEAGAGLERFRRAQDEDGTYGRALDELRGGRKRTHWIWFVFPQLAELGRSTTARYFGIASLAEATAYLADPTLGPRLRECAAAVLAAGGSAEQLLGAVDALKLRSSMTLFDRAARDAGAETPSPFAAVLDRFYDGRGDDLTAALLGPG